MGFYNNGQFNLSVSLRYTPAAQELAFLCQVVQEASRVLFDATDGQHSIGQVHFAPDGLGGEDADIWVHPNDDVWPNSTAARIWFKGSSLDMSQDYMFHPTILAHELAHYLYDLRDEYNKSTSCQNDITTQASLMEGYDWNVNCRWTTAGGEEYDTFSDFFADFTAGTALLQTGRLNEFCHSGNHNDTADNNQNNLNGNQSCWDYMVPDANHGDIPYNLTLPGAGGPVLAAPNPGPPPTVCVELLNVQRYMLVLDRSGSMAGRKLDQLKAGAHFWTDYVHAGEELGMTQFSTASNLISSMSEVPSTAATQTAWRNDQHSKINGLTASGLTGIGDALRMGLNEILAEGSASAQVILLFTDGLQNSGSETAEQVLPDAVAAGVRVYTIGLGADQDDALLTSIAESTGGMYFGISDEFSEDSAADAVSDALALVAGHSRSNGAVMSFEEIDGASVKAVFTPQPGAVPFKWQPEIRRKSSRKTVSFKFPVQITKGSTLCTLGVKWYDRNKSFKIKVTDPSGADVSTGHSARFVSGRYPYAFYEVEKPAPGKWTVEVFGEVYTSKFRTIGFEVNPLTRFEVNAKKYHIKAGEKIELRARLLYGDVLPGVKLLATLLTPSGAVKTAGFFENTGAAGDKEEAGVYTASFETSHAEQGMYLIHITASAKKKKYTRSPDEWMSKKPGYDGLAVKKEAPAVDRQKTLTILASRLGDCHCDKEERVIPGYNTKGVWIHPKQRELLRRRKERKS